MATKPKRENRQDPSIFPNIMVPMIVDPAGVPLPRFIIDADGAREHDLRLADGRRCDSTGKPVEPKP